MVEESTPLEQPGPPSQEEKSRLPLAMLIGAAVVAAALGGGLLLNRRQAAPRPAALSTEAQAYSSQIQFSELRLGAADNMVGSQIIYLDGRIANGGTKRVRLLRVQLEFQDTLSQVVLREERDVIPLAIPALGPGETRDFQLRFDRLPASWNIRPPQFQILSLHIE